MPAPLPTSAPDERQRLTDEWLDVATSTTEPSERHAARAQVVLANLGVARSIAAQFRDRGIPREDLEQVAYVGLVAAAHRFEARDEGDFLSFAVPTIRGEIRRHFRDFGWTVRPPRRVQEIQLRVLAARERLAAAHDTPPSVEDIARDLGESTAARRRGAAAGGLLHADVPRAPAAERDGDASPTCSRATTTTTTPPRLAPCSGLP